MEASAFIKNKNGVETTKTCRACLSTCDDLELLPNDECGQYKFGKLFDCTGVQANLLPGVPSYLCTNCESRLDKIALVNVFTETQNTVKNEADISKDHLGHSVEQTVGTELLIKTEVTTPNAAHDLPLIQRNCTAFQVNWIHDNHPDDLFEAEENPIAIKAESEDVDEQDNSHPNPIELICQDREDSPAPTNTCANDSASESIRNADISKDHLGCSVDQTVGAELLIKTEVTTPDTVHDLPLIQRNCTALQVNFIHDNHPDDLFEAEENPIAIKAESEDVDGQDNSHPIELICQDREDSPAPTNTSVNDSASESIRNGIAAIDAGKSVKKPRSSTLKNHLGIHTGEKPYVCEICEQRFSSLTNLAQHKKIHKKDQQHHCPHCPSKFAQLSNLKNHVRIHTDEKPYVCEVCVQAFRTSSNLAQHKKIHNKDQKHHCPHCPSKFAQLSNLKNHIRIHTGKKSYVCEVCDQALSSLSNLAQHKKIHNKDQQHQCPHCPYKFAQLSTLNAHIRIHTGEKPYVCEICVQAFRTSSTLAQHKKIHNKDQQHQCPHCPSKYTQLFNLNNHIRIHTGEKPFMCKNCNKAFHSSPALASHSKSHKKD